MRHVALEGLAPPGLTRINRPSPTLGADTAGAARSAARARAAWARRSPPIGQARAGIGSREQQHRRVPLGTTLGASWAEGDQVSMVRRWLVVVAGLFAIGELIDGIVYRLPPGIVFAVILALCTWWAARSPGRAPAAVLGVLAAIEFLLVVFVYSRGEDPAAWWRLVLYGALSLAVAVLAGVDLTRTRSRPRTEQQHRA